ncbi:hypothetical protein M9435_006954 [Picochlorum sp. BPE23]|nr:hypothetical protein M9435_006954 [Picochlorum sp. BPE23]
MKSKRRGQKTRYKAITMAMRMLGSVAVVIVAYIVHSLFLLGRDPQNSSPETRICANMIVKDEAHTIVSTMENLDPHVYQYCICDTGSTDETVSLIQDHFRRSGKTLSRVLHHRWRNFGHNRNLCLRDGYTAMRKGCDYWLVLDADQQVYNEGGERLVDLALTHDAYRLREVSHGSEYHHLRVIRVGENWRYEGVIHEVLDSTRPFRSGDIPTSFYTLHDTKFNRGMERDIEIMEDELKRDPSNSRLAFHLALAYFNVDKPKAVPWYARRIQFGPSSSQDEEVFWSTFALAQLVDVAQRTKNADLIQALQNEGILDTDTVTIEEVQNAYMHAADVKPYRFEPWLHVASLYWYYPEHKDAHACYRFASKGVKAGPIQPHTLFAQNTTEYSLNHLACACGLEAGQPRESWIESCSKVVNDLSKISHLTSYESALKTDCENIIINNQVTQ